jgi:hypothetical protein
MSRTGKGVMVLVETSVNGRPRRNTSGPRPFGVEHNNADYTNTTKHTQDHPIQECHLHVVGLKWMGLRHSDRSGNVETFRCPTGLTTPAGFFKDVRGMTL